MDEVPTDVLETAEMEFYRTSALQLGVRDPILPRSSS